MAVSEYDPELLKLAWTQLHQEWPTIVKMCQIAVRHGREHWHEALSEVAIHLPDILLSWNPAGGRTLNSHVIGNCRWFIYKQFVWKKREHAKRFDAAKPGLVIDETLLNGEQAEQEDIEEVQYILSGLSENDIIVLRLYFMEGLTLAQLSEVLECSKSQADRLLTSALHQAKVRASRMK